MSSPTSPTQALCLLALVVVVTIGAASAVKQLPGSCLMAASTLCANADTNAMRCLTKLAIHGDARVPSACAEAIMAGVTINPHRNKSSRTQQLSRMLTEGPCTAGNTCASDFQSVTHQRCNDANNGCSCSQNTHTIIAGGYVDVVLSTTANPNDLNCANICCRGVSNNAVACCISATMNTGAQTSVWCSSGITYCNPQ